MLSFGLFLLLSGTLFGRVTLIFLFSPWLWLESGLWPWPCVTSPVTSWLSSGAGWLLLPWPELSGSTISLGILLDPHSYLEFSIWLVSCWSIMTDSYICLSRLDLNVFLTSNWYFGGSSPGWSFIQCLTTAYLSSLTFSAWMWSLDLSRAALWDSPQ